MLEDFLVELNNKDGDIYYHPNGGNAGDALINIGFYQLASKISLKFKEIDDSFNDFKVGDTILIAGGGCIVPEWDSVSKYISKVVSTPARIVILPQSVAGRADIMKLMRATDTVILREKYSYEYCLSLDLRCSIFLNQDMALYIDNLNIGFPIKSLRASLGWKGIVRFILIAFHAVRSRFVNEIFSLRCDAESINSGTNKKIYNDLSLVCGFGASDKKTSMLSAYFFIMILSKYKKIYTDRLHVMIGAVLVGTEVVASSNSYYKIKGVYEFSLRDSAYKRLVSFNI